MQQRAVDIRRGLPKDFCVSACKRDGEYTAIAVVEAIFLFRKNYVRVCGNDLPVDRRFGKAREEPQSAGDGNTIQRCIRQIDAIASVFAIFRRFADSALHGTRAKRNGCWRGERHAHKPHRHAHEKHRPHRFFEEARGKGADQQHEARDQNARERKPLANQQPEQQSDCGDGDRARMKPRRTGGIACLFFFDKLRHRVELITVNIVCQLHNRVTFSPFVEPMFPNMKYRLSIALRVTFSALC